MFFTYAQNNSGGKFDPEAPLFLIIEAPNAATADALAVNAGAYFHGCAAGRDCRCCGDRWYPAFDSSGRERPEIYGEPCEAYQPPSYYRRGAAPVYRIHFLDGRVESGAELGFPHDAEET